MFVNDGRKVVSVWVFTAYDDGTIDVTQTSPFKDKFAEVERGMTNILKWLKRQMKDKDKCPYSPNNPVEIRHKDINEKDEII